MELLNKKQLSELNKTFHIFENKNGCIDLDCLGSAIRSLGIPLGETEVSSITSELSSQKMSEVEYGVFAGLVSGRLKDVDLEVELREAFAFFDREGKNLVPLEELRYVLTSFGKPIKTADFDMLAAESGLTGQKEIDFEAFKKLIV